MPRRGPKKKPLQVSTSAASSNSESKIPDPPEWLPPVAAIKYSEICRYLIAESRFTLASVELAIQYAISHDNLVATLSELAQSGRFIISGDRKVSHPALALQQASLGNLRQIASKLGLNPPPPSGMPVVGDGESGSMSALDDFLKDFQDSEG